MLKATGICFLIMLAACQAEVDEEEVTFQALRVAHAGGGLGKTTYTNSYQALNASIKKGFSYFEIDFTFTGDQQLVCLHDWTKSFKRTFGFETDRRLLLAEFEKLAAENQKYTNCTLHGLAAWMRENPSAYIVTDVKDDNLTALKQILEVLPDAASRVIPQIYKPDNFETVNSMGFQQIIWTLYRYSGTGYGDRILQWIDSWPAKVAVTMPKDRAATSLPDAIRSRGVPTYVHTVNRYEEMEEFLTKFGVTEIYTDFLTPMDQPGLSWSDSNRHSKED